MSTTRLAWPLVISAFVSASASGAIVSFEAMLSGPAESPPNASPGIGFAIVDMDTTAHTMRVRAEFSGLVGPVTVCHIHAATAAPFAGTAGVATPVPTFPGFPSGVTSGTYDMMFDTSLASSWNPAYVTANGGTPLSAEAAFFSAMSTGRAYFNVHSSTFPGGEIRGFFIPSPGAATVMALAGLTAIRRRRR